MGMGYEGVDCISNAPAKLFYWLIGHCCVHLSIGCYCLPCLMPSEKSREWDRMLLNALELLKLSIGFDANIKSGLIYFEN